MTYNRQQRYKNLQERVRKTYTAWASNTDKRKDEKLHEQWMKAHERLDSFLEKISLIEA